jgi:glutaredoxin-like protein NrdH
MDFSKVAGKNNKHKVVLYALSTCMWCKLTKQFFEENNIEYEYVDVDLLEEKEKEKVRKYLQEKGGTLAYPTVVVDDVTLITGFRKDELKKVLEL